MHLAWAAIATGGILWEVADPASTRSEDWVWPFGLLPFPVAGAVLLALRPANPIGRLLTAVGVAAGTIFIGGWLAGITRGRFSEILELVSSAVVIVTFWGIVALLYLFPNGRLPTRWLRWPFWACTVMLLVVVPPALFFRPGPMDVTGRENPLGGPEWLVTFFDQALLALPLGAVFGIVALVGRFRRSEGVERAQLSMFLTGAAFVIGLLVLISPLTDEDTTGVVDVLMRIVVVGGFWALPLAVVAAVLRYRLYEIDRIVSRTVTYAVVVGVLLAAYSGSVVLLRGLLPVEGDLPVAVSTLAVASVFLPLARRVQRAVDRRFFRSRYDAGQVVARVADELRHSLDLAQVTARTESVLAEALAPETVALWVADDSD